MSRSNSQENTVKTYRLAHAYTNGDFVEVESTDPLVIRHLRDDITQVLQRETPKFQLSIGVGLDSKEAHILYLSNLKDNNRGKGSEVLLWIERWLCEHGWEPFSVHNFFVYFRQESNE